MNETDDKMANERPAADAAPKNESKSGARRPRKRSGRTVAPISSDTSERSGSDVTAADASGRSDNPRNTRRPDNPGKAAGSGSSGRSNHSGNSGRRNNSGHGRHSDAVARREPRAAAAGGGRTGGRWTWRDYVLQFSVVILGVMVTFIGSGLIERWRTAREVRTVMQLVHEELMNNRQELASICVSLNRDRLGMELLHAHGMDYKKVPADSLEKYQYILGAMRDFKPHADALEVLRSSGTIMEIGDKQLLFDVLGCYAWMERFSTAVDNYNAQKLASLNHLFSAGLHGSIGGPDPVESWRVMMDDTMCAAFIGTMANFFGRELLEGEAVARLDGVAQAVAEKYRFE